MKVDKSIFPDPRQSDKTGLLCVGGDLSPEMLLDAYSQGIFPWPHEGYPLLWFSPKERGVLDFDKLHVPRSLRKDIKGLCWEFSLDQDFSAVMNACGTAPRKGQSGTWITPEMFQAYNQLHKLGYSHSLECREKGKLIGGIYGVYVDGVFSAESMFGTVSSVSKVCLILLCRHLLSMGLGWLDIQMVTPVAESLGGRLISQAEFLERLTKTKELGAAPWKKTLDTTARDGAII